MHMVDMRLHNAMRNVCQFEFSKHHFTKSCIAWYHALAIILWNFCKCACTQIM